MSHSHAGRALPLSAVTELVPSDASSSEETLRSRGGEMMGSLLLWEQWPGHRDGRLPRPFARAAAAMAAARGPALVRCACSRSRPGQALALPLSQQMAKELISLANSKLD